MVGVCVLLLLFESRPWTQGVAYQLPPCSSLEGASTNSVSSIHRTMGYLKELCLLSLTANSYISCSVSDSFLNSLPRVKFKGTIDYSNIQ